MVGHLVSELVGTSTGSPALQLMAPAVEKAIQFCLIAALPVGGCLGWLTGELIRRATIGNKLGVRFHLLNALAGTVGFLSGAYISFQRGPSGSVLALAVLSSVVLVLIVRFCIYILFWSAKIEK
jgi:hypothetical protein